MGWQIEWDESAIEHIRNRSRRYADAVDIEPEWAQEVVEDPDRLVDEPDPWSAHANSVRVVGYSHSADMVIHRGSAAGPQRTLARRIRVEDTWCSPTPVHGGRN